MFAEKRINTTYSIEDNIAHIRASENSLEALERNLGPPEDSHSLMDMTEVNRPFNYASAPFDEIFDIYREVEKDMAPMHMKKRTRSRMMKEILSEVETLDRIHPDDIRTVKEDLTKLMDEKTKNDWEGKNKELQELFNSAEGLYESYYLYDRGFVDFNVLTDRDKYAYTQLFELIFRAYGLWELDNQLNGNDQHLEMFWEFAKKRLIRHAFFRSCIRSVKDTRLSLNHRAICATRLAELGVYSTDPIIEAFDKELYKLTDSNPHNRCNWLYFKVQCGIETRENTRRVYRETGNKFLKYHFVDYSLEEIQTPFDIVTKKRDTMPPTKIKISLVHRRR